MEMAQKLLSFLMIHYIIQDKPQCEEENHKQ